MTWRGIRGVERMRLIRGDIRSRVEALRARLELRSEASGGFSVPETAVFRVVGPHSTKTILRCYFGGMQM
jgi:hypothetical protein